MTKKPEHYAFNFANLQVGNAKTKSKSKKVTRKKKPVQYSDNKLVRLLVELLKALAVAEEQK